MTDLINSKSFAELRLKYLENLKKKQEQHLLLIKQESSVLLKQLNETVDTELREMAESTENERDLKLNQKEGKEILSLPEKERFDLGKEIKKFWDEWESEVQVSGDGWGKDGF